MADLRVNELHFGDNLTVLREKVPDEIADLIYLDPPFNSNRSYNLLFKQAVKGKGKKRPEPEDEEREKLVYEASPAQIMAFEDTWQWHPNLWERFSSDQQNAPLFRVMSALKDIVGESEMLAYLTMMAPRLLELHRKLKPTGSLYLHCDPAACHYLKVLLDVIFLPYNFRNEIVWKRTSGHSDARGYGAVHDTILFYCKTDRFQWNATYQPYDEAYVEQYYRYTDDQGRRFMSGDLGAAGLSGGGYDYEWRGVRRVWRVPLKTMERLETEGRIFYTKNGIPRHKRYLDEAKGMPTQDLWSDIESLRSWHKERRGYPTQKPLPLLERIIAASTNEGDVVMDPFCGCGTALVAAERMNRRWLGIDITYLAINEVISRLKTECVTGRPLEYRLIGTPTDALGAEKLFEGTRAQNHKPFEIWAVTLVNGQFNDKMGADKGIDGRIPLWLPDGYKEILVQVKGGNAASIVTAREFAHVITDRKAVMGLMITMREPTREMLAVAESLGSADLPTAKKYPRYQIRTVKQLLEEPRCPFEIPDSYLTPQTGVGKLQPDHQKELELGG